MNGGRGFVQLNNKTVVGLSRLSLESLLLGFSLLDGSLVSFVVGDSSLQLLLTLGRSDVFDSNVHELLHDSAVDELVDSDTEGSLGDVEDNTGSSLVSLVGHTLVDGRVDDDIDVITDLVDVQVSGEGKSTSLSELLGEKISSSSSVTE